MKSIYRALSLLNLFRAASRGPAALARNRARQVGFRWFARLLRKVGL